MQKVLDQKGFRNVLIIKCLNFLQYTYFKNKNYVFLFVMAMEEFKKF